MKPRPFCPPPPRPQVLFFSVKHYADTVEYCAADWVDKNQDNVSSATRALMSLSRNKILLTIFSAQRDDGGAGRDRSKSYLASKFREQLRSLLGTIQKTQVQYVRCVKPNMAKSPAEFDMFKVVEQLRCAGVIEAIRITRARFPDRLPHVLLCQRFGVLVERSRARDARLVLQDLVAPPAAGARPGYAVGKVLSLIHI